jgi:histidyl-tRNA synthetase
LSKQPTTAASGFRDFMPAEVQFRRRTIATILGVFETSGFMPIETPAVERLETLTGKYGDEGEKLIFKVMKRGEELERAREAGVELADMALRYDLTVPTMRFYAHHQAKLPKIFKRYQVGPVWRADRPGRGRYREFYQCDIDVFGSAAPIADAEVVVTLGAALEAVGLGGFTIRISSRKLLEGLTVAYGIPAERKVGFITALDKVDKVGLDGFFAELATLGLGDAVLALVRADFSQADVEAAIRARCAGNESGRAGLAEADAIVRLSRPQLRTGTVAFDPMLARGLDYYTGFIFEIVSADAKGSIAGGGRYDNLASMFQKASVPVTGGSLGIERILLLLEAQAEAAVVTGPQVFVTCWSDDLAEHTVALAALLRQAGIRTDIELAGRKLGQQLAFADSLGCRLAVIAGPDEVAKGVVTVKDLARGEQETLPADGLVAHVRSGL